MKAVMLCNSSWWTFSEETVNKEYEGTAASEKSEASFMTIEAYAYVNIKYIVGGDSMAFHIVLVEPEIPANTGNISRTCAATGAVLHLVRPLGFSTDDAKLKRAGLDYWHAVSIEYHDSFEHLMDKYKEQRFWFATTKAETSYHEINFADHDFLVFGKETAGLPASMLEKHQDHLIRLPMTDQVRSMNLSNCAAIILFEALRQTGFPGLH